MAKIVKVEYVRTSKYAPTIIMAELDNSEIVDVTEFYEDEIWVPAYRIIGKTVDEAVAVKVAIDIAYLRN